MTQRLEHGNKEPTLQIYGSYAMNIEEKELLKRYLTHLNILGKDGTHAHIEAWYQEVRYAQGPNAPHSVMEASELRYKDVLEAARIFNQLVATNSDQPIS